MENARAMRFGRMFCLVGAALGALGLLGHASGAKFLTTIVPGEPPMVPLSAVGLLLVGLAGALLAEQYAPVRRTSSLVAATVVLVIGVLTLAEYALSVDLAIDRLLFPSSVGPYPGRPSPPTAAAFVLLALALLSLESRANAASRVSEWLVMTAGLIGLTAVLGQLFGEGVLYRLPHAPVVGVAVPTAVSLLCSCVGLLLIRPRGVMRFLTSTSPAGALLRRLMLAALLAPAMLGFGVTKVFAALDIDDTSLTGAALSAVTIAVSLVLLSLTAAPFERALEELRVSREQTRDLVEQASDGIFVTDAARHTEVNDAACRMLGYTHEELARSTIESLIPADELARVGPAMEELTAGRTHIGEWTLVRKDGVRVPVEASARILPDGRLQVFVRDIGERKRLERALRLSEAKATGILAISPDAIITVDRDQRVTLFNAAAESIFGYAREEVLGRPLDILLPERLREKHQGFLKVLATGADVVRGIGERTVAIWGLRKNGEEFPADAAVSKLEIGGELVLTVALRDMTERRRLEEQLRLAVRARDEMLGVVAHDLRNPLNTIGLQAQLLRGRKDADDGLRDAVAGIERASLRMQRLIRDLLDVTRTEAGTLSVERTALPTQKIVAECAEAQRDLCAKASLDLRVEVDPRVADVWADRDRVQQVFENLVGNAVKFTPPGGRITLGAATRGDGVLFWVRDTGEGIPASDLPHVFDRFWQAHETRRFGAGLGLAIVKGIVESHGGGVWAESKLHEGTTIFFTLPRAPRPPLARSAIA